MPCPKKNRPPTIPCPSPNPWLDLSIELIHFFDQTGDCLTSQVGVMGRGKGGVCAGVQGRLLEGWAIVQVTLRLDPRGRCVPRSTNRTSRGTRQRSQVTSLQLHSSRVPAGVEPGLSVCLTPELGRCCRGSQDLGEGGAQTWGGGFCLFVFLTWLPLAWK